MSSNPSQLFLLSDHIKLSLLERQRAQSLSLSATTQDAQITRSLDSLSSGIATLKASTSTTETSNTALSSQISQLERQYADLNAQFQGLAAPTLNTTTPNDSRLSEDFEAAKTVPAARNSKSVRFRDDAPTDEDEEATRSALFRAPYRDEPEDTLANQDSLDNQQIHQYHTQVLRDQDDQLDRLGLSIGRQRELTIQIGDELDSQALMLDEVDERVDRQQGQLNRAKGRLNRVARKAKENWSLTTIVVLIIVLILLIVITKR